MMKPLSFVVMVLLAPLLAFAAPVSTPMSAGHLFAACNESTTNDFARGFCDGAIDALYGSIQDWCVPASVTHSEVKTHVKKELLKSSLSPSISASDFVNRSVQKKWPCP
jgi:hypothetical protein